MSVENTLRASECPLHLNPRAGSRTVTWVFYLKSTTLVGPYIWQGIYLRS